MTTVTEPTTAFPNYEPAGTPRHGCCHIDHCDQPATHEIYAAAGPEYGDLTADPAQVRAIHPCCAGHAARLRQKRDGYGPAPAWSFDRFATATEEVPW